MKKIAALLCALMLLVGVAGCKKVEEATPAPTPTAEPIPVADVATETEATPEPAPEEPVIPTEPVQLGALPIWVTMPVSWNGNVTIEEVATENPDIAASFVAHFTPKDVELSQNSRLGQFFVVEDAKWATMDGKFDTPVTMLGSQGGYTIGYSGTSDNPYVIDTDAEKLFGTLMLRNKNAQGTLQVQGSAQ